MKTEKYQGVAWTKVNLSLIDITRYYKEMPINLNGLKRWFKETRAETQNSNRGQY